MSAQTILEKLFEGDVTRPDVERVVDLAIEHARIYIHWLIWRRGYSIQPLGLSEEDLAYDLIAELVSEFDGPRLERMQQAMKGILDNNGQDIALESAFKAVICRNVRSNLARLFMEIHPVRARLLITLRRYVASSGDITRIDSVAGYLYHRSETDPNLKTASLQQEQLRALIGPVHPDGHPVRVVLHALLSGLAAITDARQAVAEDDILDLTLELLHLEHRHTTKDFVSTEQDSNAHDLYRHLQDTLESLRETISGRYVSNGKLSESEADAMLSAAELYLTDLSRGDTAGHFHYLRQVLPGLTHARYRSSYRSVYEYLIRSIFTSTRYRLQ